MRCVALVHILISAAKLINQMEPNFIGGVPWEEEIQICTMKLILNGEGLVRGLKVGN